MTSTLTATVVACLSLVEASLQGTGAEKCVRGVENAAGHKELYLPPIAACIEISIKTCVKLLDDNAPTPSG